MVVVFVAFRFLGSCNYKQIFALNLFDLKNKNKPNSSEVSLGR